MRSPHWDCNIVSGKNRYYTFIAKLAVLMGISDKDRCYTFIAKKGNPHWGAVSDKNRYLYLIIAKMAVKSW